MNYTKLNKIEKLYFGYEEVSRALGIGLASARVSATRYVKQGFLIRLKRNFYILKHKWENAGKEEKFILANLMQVPSYISLMTAMDYYEITTQMQQDFIESVGIKRTKETEIEGTIFNYSKINKKLYFGFVKEKGVFMASPEKAFLDALYLTSLKRYRLDRASVDLGKLDITKLKKLVKKFPIKTRKALRDYGYF